MNLEKLCTAEVIIDALKAEDDLDIAEFTKQLNHFIHGYGDIGYDDAVIYNLMTERKYTEKEAKELLEQISETKKLKKDNIEIREIDKVPHGIAYELADAVQGGACSVCDARNTEIKYGIIKGHELVGFVSGNNWRDTYISIDGLYIRKDYRKMGLSTKLLKIMMDIAEKEGVKGLFMGNASWAGQGALRALKKQFDKEGNTNIVFEEFSEDFSNKAGLYFKDKMKD